MPTAATDPVLVVTLGSLDKLTQDVNYITGVVGQAHLGGMFSMVANGYFQGLDVNQPIGVLVPLVDGVPQPIAVLPTDDVKAILKRFEAQTGGPADELDDGTMVISMGANTVFIRQMGDWAALAPRKDVLDLTPADPTSLFDGMGNRLRHRHPFEATASSAGNSQHAGRPNSSRIRTGDAAARWTGR